MSAHFPASAGMAMAEEALQGWDRLEEKLTSKLFQLTKLLHHFSAFPPESPDGNEDEIAGQHESEIHEILHESASRIRDFKTSLEIQIQDNRVQETIEALSSQYEALREASDIELKGSISRAEQLEKDVEELQKSLKDKTESFARELMLVGNELLAKTNEFESARQEYLSEIARLKNDHESEMLAESERAKNEMLQLTQELTQAQARVSELQEMATTKLEEHTQALEKTNTLHKAEIERLKLESFIELEKWSQEWASREAGWHAQEVEYQAKLTEAAKEKIQITLSSKLQAEEGTLLLEASKQSLTKEKEMTGKLQTALCQAEEENRTLKENLTNAMSNNDKLSKAFVTLKNEACAAERTHNSAISELETTANRLRAELEKMTNACVANEKETENYKVKVDKLSSQILEKRKEMNLMVIEIDQLKKENESSGKMKENLEAKIQEQNHAHQQTLQKLQTSFLSQLEEHKKGNELQLESMEEKILRQKEEKARAKDACAEYMKALGEVERTLRDQESKFVLRFQAYGRKIAELEQKLITFESKGPALEDDLNSLLKMSYEDADQSKQVCMYLQETRAAYSALERKLAALTQECGATTMRYTEEIELLKKNLSEEDRAHKLVLANASHTHASQIQQLAERQDRALAELRREHEIEIDALSVRIQAQKDAEMAEHEAKMESFLRRNKMECSEEVELMTLEHDRALRELKRALEAAEKKEAILVRAHMNALKTQQEESEEEMATCKRACAETIRTSESVSQRLAHELYSVKEDHIVQIREMGEDFQLQLSRVEKLEAKWRKEANNLQVRVSELETLIIEKDERIKGLMHDITNIEESSRVALVEMTTKHQQNILDLSKRQQDEMKEARLEGSAMIEKLQTEHRSELQASQRLAEKANLRLRDVKIQFEEKLEKLQKRFDSRESRQDDVVRIMELQETCVQKDSTIEQLHSKTSQLKLELVNREDSYNRIFGYSPMVRQGISDWLRPKSKAEAVKVDSVRVKVETSKEDFVKFQKRATSARRTQMKGPDPLVRSASNQL